MEQIVKDLQKSLNEAEEKALMGNRKQIQKLESRVGIDLGIHGVLTTPNSRPCCPENYTRYSLPPSSLLLIALSDGQISMDSFILA